MGICDPQASELRNWVHSDQVWWGGVGVAPQLSPSREEKAVPSEKALKPHGNGGSGGKSTLGIQSEGLLVQVTESVRGSGVRSCKQGYLWAVEGLGSLIKGSRVALGTWEA